MAYPYAPYPAPPPKPPRRLKGPVALSVIGLVIGLLGIGTWVVAFYMIGDGVSEAAAYEDEVRGDLDAEIDVPGSVDVELGDGTHTIYAMVPSDTSTGPTTTSELGGASPAGVDPDLDVTVTAADGTSLPVDVVDFADTYTDSATDTDLYEVGEVFIREPGTYTVTVADAAGARPADKAGIGERASLSGEAAGSIIGGGLLFFLGFAIGALGGLILLIGLIWLLVAALA